MCTDLALRAVRFKFHQRHLSSIFSGIAFKMLSIVHYLGSRIETKLHYTLCDDHNIIRKIVVILQAIRNVQQKIMMSSFVETKYH